MIAMRPVHLDSSRLIREAHKAQAVRPINLVGRETTGVTAAVRSALPVIRKLRLAKVTWSAIAAAISEQGLVRSDGSPLTASRLTAIVSQVERQRQRREESAAARRRRPDVAPLATHDSTLSVSPSTAAKQSPNTASAGAEEELRRTALAELHALLRKE
jgi:hypothetical protein